MAQGDGIGGNLSRQEKEAKGEMEIDGDLKINKFKERAKTSKEKKREGDRRCSRTRRQCLRRCVRSMRPCTYRTDRGTRTV